MTHTCECGNEIVTQGWNNNINTILRCSECQAKREALLTQITQAITGKTVEMVYVSTDVYYLLTPTDFTVEVSRRRAERMHGQTFQVVEF